MSIFRSSQRHQLLSHRILSAFIAVAFSLTSVLPPGYAQSIAPLNLPEPGTMVPPSAAFVPVLLKGMTIHPENPLQFDFIIDTGNSGLDAGNGRDHSLQKESEKLVKYFLAAMTIPKDDLWVNLSPYESDKIIPGELGKTELGRDMLAQDYILKQLTASLMYPEKELGQEFWAKVYQKAKEKYGTTEIPVNTFNKVWVLPETATVYEHGQTVYIVEARLRVMLDSDYQAMNAGVGTGLKPVPTDHDLSVSTEIIREIILPEIEREVNEGQNFAPLRQIYHSLILAKWYKETVKASVGTGRDLSLLERVYIDQKKIAGVESGDETLKDQIYAQYMEAYKKGVFNYIKEDYDRLSNETIPRKYFSGGEELVHIPLKRTENFRHLPNIIAGENHHLARVNMAPQRGGKLSQWDGNALALALAVAITCTGWGCGDSRSASNDKISKQPAAAEIGYQAVKDNLRKLDVNEFKVNQLIAKGNQVVTPLVNSIRYGPYSGQPSYDYTGISVVLNGIGDPRTVPLLIEEFEKESINFRGRTSSEAAPVRAVIEHLNNKVFVPDLIKALNHPDLYLRSFIVHALGAMADQRARPYIIEAFRSALREASGENKPYTEMNEKSRANLVLLEKSIYALDRLNAVEVTSILEEVILSDMWGRWSSRHSGLSNFSELKSQFAQTYIKFKQTKGGAITHDRLLVRLLASRDPAQLRYIQDLIIKKGGNTAPELNRLINNEGFNIDGTGFAVEALLKVGDARGAVLAILKLNSSEHGIGYSFRREIGNWRQILSLKDKAVPGLLEAVNDQDDRVRWLATILLGDIEYGSEHFENKYLLFRGNFNNRDVMNALIDRLAMDNKYEIRRAAWESLKKLGIEPLRGADLNVPSPSSPSAPPKASSPAPIFEEKISIVPQGLPERRHFLAAHYDDLYTALVDFYKRQARAGRQDPSGVWKSFFKIIEDGDTVEYALSLLGADGLLSKDAALKAAETSDTVFVQNVARSARPARAGKESQQVDPHDPRMEILVPANIIKNQPDELYLEWTGPSRNPWWLTFNPFAIWPQKDNVAANDQPFHMTVSRADGRVYQSEMNKRENIRDMISLFVEMNKAVYFHAAGAFRVAVNGWYYSDAPDAPKGGASQSQAHAQILRFAFPVEHAKLERNGRAGPIQISTLADGWGTGIVLEAPQGSEAALGELTARTLELITRKGHSFNILIAPGEAGAVRVFIADRIKGTPEPYFTNEWAFAEFGRAVVVDDPATFYQLSPVQQDQYDSFDTTTAAGRAAMVQWTGEEKRAHRLTEINPRLRGNALEALRIVTAPQEEIDVLVKALASSPILTNIAENIRSIEQKLGKLSSEEIDEKVKKVLEAVQLKKVRDVPDNEKVYVDILEDVGKNAEIVGVMDRSAAEYFGYIHQTVNAIVMTPDLKKVVLIRRSHKTDPYPYHLSIPGGHPLSGQTDEEGITARLKSELGLPSLQGKLQDVRTYSYGFDEITEADSTKERRKLFIYRLSEDEYRAILQANIIRHEQGRDGNDAIKQWLEKRNPGQAESILSYHEIEMDKLTSARLRRDEESPYANKETRFLEIDDIVSGGKTEAFVTPDLLHHLLNNQNLVKRLVDDIDKMQRGEEILADEMISPYRRIVFLGPIASGKSTQAKMVAKDLGVPHISAGDLFRDVIEFMKDPDSVDPKKQGYLKDIERSLRPEDINSIRDSIAKGVLVKNTITDKIVQIRLLHDDTHHGFVLDGYPREESSARDLESFLRSHSLTIDRYIDIDVSESVSNRRLDAGNEDRKDRTDDKDTTARENRLRVYRERTKPMLEAREDRVIRISGDQPLDYVTDEIVDALFVSSRSSSPVTREEAAAYQQNVKTIFREKDKEAEEMFGPAASAETYKSLLARNGADRGESLSINAPLGDSPELVSIHRQVQDIVAGRLSQPVVEGDNYVILDQIHLTAASVEIADTPNHLNLSLESVFEDARKDAEGLAPFDITMVGPHLMLDGVVVMEYEISDPAFLQTRKAAERRIERDKAKIGANKAFVPNIYYSTVAVLTDPGLQPETLAALRNDLDALRAEIAAKRITTTVRTMQVSEYRKDDRRIIRSRKYELSSSPAASNAYEEFYDQIRAGTEGVTEISEGHLRRSRAFLDSTGRLKSREDRRKNGAFGVTEVFFLPESETRSRMAAFQRDIKELLGDKVYLVDADKLHMTTQGLEKLAMHEGKDTIDLDAKPYLDVRSKARSIETSAVKMQVAGVNWNTDMGIFWELRPYLESQGDPVLQRRQQWGLGQPRPPHVTAAYFAQPLSTDDVKTLKRLTERYHADHFGDINVDRLQVIAYEDLSFNAGYKVLEMVELKASSPAGEEERRGTRDVRRETKDEVGGIDMNDIDVNRQGTGVDIRFDPVEMQEIIDAGIDGFAPVIINITPLPSVLPLLGLEPADKEEEWEVSRIN